MKILIQELHEPPHEAIYGCAFQFEFLRPKDRTKPEGEWVNIRGERLDPGQPGDPGQGYRVGFRFRIPDRDDDDDSPDGDFLWRYRHIVTYMTADEMRKLAGQLLEAADDFERDPTAN
jgi:hypothetical protein